jgi:late competence protein required for DNA uptake (superfamily II DNA/RNA helicase)
VTKSKAYITKIDQKHHLRILVAPSTLLIQKIAFVIKKENIPDRAINTIRGANGKMIHPPIDMIIPKEKQPMSRKRNHVTTSKIYSLK